MPDSGIAKRSLARLTFPIFIDLIFVFLVSATDAWFLSQISDTSAASVGAILPILGVAFTIFATLNQVGCAIASQRMGAKDFTALAHSYGILIYVALALGLLVSILLIGLSERFTIVLGLNSEMGPMASEYIYILGFGTTLLAGRYALAAILASQGLTKWNMYSTAIMSLVNILFNYLFVFGAFGFPTLGITGVAIASVIAWCISFCFSLSVVFAIKNIDVVVRISKAKALSQLSTLRRMMLPSLMEPMSWQLMQIVITMMVITMGELELATRIYCFNLVYVAVMFGLAISAGVQIKVGYFIGANRPDEAKQTLISANKIAIVCVAAYMAGLAWYYRPILSLFSQNAAIIELGRLVIYCSIPLEITRQINMIVGASLRATGDVRFTSMMGFTVMWLICLPLCYLLGLSMELGLIGITIAMALDECIRGGLNGWRWYSGKWQSKGLYAR